jgi:hypothetical protein
MSDEVPFRERMRRVRAGDAQAAVEIAAARGMGPDVVRIRFHRALERPGGQTRPP